MSPKKVSPTCFRRAGSMAPNLSSLRTYIANWATDSFIPAKDIQTSIYMVTRHDVASCNWASFHPAARQKVIRSWRSHSLPRFSLTLSLFILWLTYTRRYGSSVDSSKQTSVVYSETWRRNRRWGARHREESRNVSSPTSAATCRKLSRNMECIGYGLSLGVYVLHSR